MSSINRQAVGQPIYICAAANFFPIDLQHDCRESLIYNITAEDFFCTAYGNHYPRANFFCTAYGNHYIHYQKIFI
jgi:hypothetical protein